MKPFKKTYKTIYLYIIRKNEQKKLANTYLRLHYCRRERA